MRTRPSQQAIVSFFFTGFLVVAWIADLQTNHDWVDNAHGIWPGTARTM